LVELKTTTQNESTFCNENNKIMPICIMTNMFRLSLKNNIGIFVVVSINNKFVYHHPQLLDIILHDACKLKLQSTIL